mgnify:CR=1 FL=1
MENAVMSYRLDQYLTLAGEGSRSQVKQFLKKGLVQVDGITEKQAKRKERADHAKRKTSIL